MNQRLHFSVQKWIRVAPVERAGFSWRFQIPLYHIDQRKFGPLKFCDLEHGQNDLIKKNMKASVTKFLLHCKSEPKSTSRRHLILSNMAIFECPLETVLLLASFPLEFDISYLSKYHSVLYNDVRTLFSCFFEN